MKIIDIITEEWSEKYKRSINCNHPKGFSQRAHCQGRKKNEDIEENFDDGKNPGRKGLSQRVGIPKNATIAQLEKHAKAPGEEGRMARWQLNMRRGRNK